MKTRGAKLLTAASAVVLVVAVASIGSAWAQLRPSNDCSSFIGPLKEVAGTPVGPQECIILSESTVRSASGEIYRRLEIGINGTIEGYTPKEGTRREMFTDAPEFALAQRGNLGPYYHGIGYYVAAKGSGMTLFLPESAEAWNGKLFVLAHGSGNYSRIGELPPRQPGEYALRQGANSYAGPMIDHGYAVAYTRRPACCSTRPPNPDVVRPKDEEVRLDDGTVLRDKTFGYHVGLLLDWTEIAKNLVQARLGRQPERTYWYGKSGGAALGRIVNYKPGANLDHEGNRMYDGMLINDAGGGWYWPVIRFSRVDMGPGVFALKPQKEDTLVVDDTYRQSFAHQIDIAHQNYTGADHVQGEYLFVKRENARLLKEKGLASRSRTYEIAGVSHSDGGGADNLDMSGMFDALIEALDRWVDQGIEPSPTRSDAQFLGDQPAVQLPELACPTGIYIEYSQEAPQPGRTTFVTYMEQSRLSINADVFELPSGYDPEWLEPVDRRGYLVDMNKNGVRDTRESIKQAWQRRWREGERYGVLAPGEELTHEHYVNCIAQVTSDLVKENLLSRLSERYYVRMAQQSDIGKSASDLALTSR